MNKKLYKVLDEIKRTEEKIAEWQEYLQELNTLRKQLEEREIVKSFRSLKLESRQLLELLTGIQSGKIPLVSIMEGEVLGNEKEMVGEATEMLEKQISGEQVSEREDMFDEEN